MYKTYTELQDHMSKELDVVTKAQFAKAMMRQLNNPKPIKIARLLGRDVLEVIEVTDTEYAEFYWHLPKVLPMACRKVNYGNDTKRYLDFHRALDQVEEIIRDVSRDSYNILPNSTKKTWLQRAQEALELPGTTSSMHVNENSTQTMQQKEAKDKEQYNFLFSSLDGIFGKCNTSYDCVSTYDCISGSADDKIIESPIEPYQTTEMRKQKQTRAHLRKVLERQRQVREGGSITCIADDDDTREGNEDSIVRSPSTDVLPGDTALWKSLNPREDPTLAKRSSKNIRRSRRYRSRIPRPTQSLIDSREEVVEDDRDAIISAARRAAARELDASFWDHLTCNAMADF